MANIRPFKALQYNPDKCGQLSDVIAPPYDIITPERREKYYAQSEYNITRLICGLIEDTDTAENNRYTRARDLLSDWLEKEVLKQNAQECIYLYEQEFSMHNHHYIHRGFVTLLELTDLSEKIVLPHEETGEAPAADRLALLSETDTYFSQVYCLYTDDEKTVHAHIKKIAQTKPDIEFEYRNGRIQRIWAVSDEKIIAEVQSLFKDKQLVIADGHHRYNAALKHRDAMRKKHPDYKPTDNFNYILTMLVAVDNPGIVLFAPHRMIKNIGMDEATAISFLKDDFIIEKIIVDRSARELADAITNDLASTNDSHIYTLYFGSNYYYRILPRDISELDAMLPDKSPAYRKLSATVLQKLLLEKYFKIKSEDFENPDVISYTRIITEALDAVQSGTQQCCVITKPSKVQQLLDVSLAGEKLPPHSTYFYPKPFSGLIMYKM